MATAASIASSASSAYSPKKDNGPILYKFKVTLVNDEFAPEGGRWRRVVVPAKFSLLEFHVVLQTVFGWTNSHLHHFTRYDNNEYIEYMVKGYMPDGIGPESKDERIYKLSDVFSDEKPLMEYEYDFGESWGHEVEFEGIVPADPKLDYPACIEGKWANRMDDNQDLDPDTGELLPRFKRKKFSMRETKRELSEIFKGRWPLKVDNTTIAVCYLCYFHLCEACNGRCCNFCLKANDLSNR